MDKFEKYYEAVRFIEGLSNVLSSDYMKKDHKIDESIYTKRMRYFLHLLGDPDKNFKFIHVTGTSGKGTVATMLQEVLFASGKNVGLFTSPFATTSIEKIRVNDKYIPPDEFADILAYLKPHIDKAFVTSPYGGPSYFELFFAISLVYFARKKCDWVVAEVGCGGRYDATNIIQNPVATVITNINYDHTHILGKTLKKIAYDKAGIIKKGSVFFTTEQRPRLLKIFEEICQKEKVKFNFIKNKSEDVKEINASLVSAVARHIGISEKDIAIGLEKTKLPCRFEIVQKNPIVILDGAHNFSKISSTIANLKKIKYKKLFLVFSIAKNKEVEEIVKIIAPVADHVFCTRYLVSERKCAPPKDLAEFFSRYKNSKAKITVLHDPSQALDMVLKLASPEDAILVTGSFFLAGELRKKWYSEEFVLKNLSSF
ncbi:hypothetical protein A2316_01625 [Candidatus Falkowbacteria bacterium RIFOXYB2_FULL_38_15]|uniref:tetrahydrofolate synthase n=1 Tax=Candidatus Falkowbacteria bacterium RIFOXYA2_FULL_38_12 TaxID=1797993 RepID=A0A1F5S1I7_9BACT|nr:MAG: hypothetical protein A2257_04055 [Candidatus Falkowbacteria bacterium RIFOXYA2_FULL_38_12]OGF32935.1 MAG: hypothetical protein A2316_01625 [Candidatus Falkowbacteria bacterium RIFOXYB2_FULL_38_15]OGF44111.1 MAG: hypothetical protein A2555_01835 [Candidatus Falkowbacteria bacterium RIFOXYD2_FULL_39_16]